MDKAGIDLTYDSDATASPDVSGDEDLRRAIALSLGSEAAESSPTKAYSNISSAQRQPQVGPVRPHGLLGIDRNKQEQERLGRLKRKRDRTVSPPQLTRQRFSGRPSMNESAPSTTNVASSLSLTLSPTPAETHTAPVSTLPNSSLQYPNGVVKQTWAFGHTRSGSDIKIEEVLQSSALQAAVLSAFQWDFDWLFPKMDTKRTSFVLVVQAKYESQKLQLRADFDGTPNVRLCFPNMEGQIACMHSKLMLLFYDRYMRIAIPTGNLRPHDWGDAGGIMENTVFLIDLPKCDTGEVGGQRTQFAEDLLHFIQAQGLPDDVLRRVRTHDFSRTADLGFVHTIGGVHAGASWKLTGHCGLGRIIAGLGLRSNNGIEVDYVTSSVGSLKDEFLRSMYLAAQGDDGLMEYTLRTSKSLPAKCMDDSKRIVKEDTGAGWKQNFHFYYPSDATVRASRGGPESAGTICFQEKWWKDSKFPRNNMRDCVSRRAGLLMHNKFLFAQLPGPITAANGRVCSGWAYCGSANLSESAWGRLVQDKVAKKPKLNCRNWECGVVIPLSVSEELKNVSEISSPLQPSRLEKFHSKIPVPMQGPARPMLPSQPWFNNG